MKEFDVVIIGSGPGGYVCAIRCAQLGMKVAIIEKYNNLGGTCLNVGCIPSKALLESSELFHKANHDFDKHGITVNPKFDFGKMVDRKNKIVSETSVGVNFLMKKNKIKVYSGFGKLNSDKTITVTNDEKTINVSAEHIIIATGARSRDIDSLKKDGEKIIGYRKAMVLDKQPKEMIIVGSGAIGVEFAYFYNSMGTKVTLVEYEKNIAPNEDKDISKELEKILKKSGINILCSTKVIGSKIVGDKVDVKVENKKDTLTISADVVLSAVGIKSNIEDIGLEDLGIEVENDKIKIDNYYRTNIDNIYAIGDVVSGPALAHVASAEGITCIENIKGLNPNPIDYNNIPGCTYCKPEVASVGYTEEKALSEGYDIKVGKFPFSASGKAQASGQSDGFVKVIFDSKYGEWLGCHMIGSNVTEMISEAVVGRKLETTGHEVLKAIHPHPTLSEAVMEAVADAYDEVIHL